MSGVKSSGEGLMSILNAVAQLSQTEVLVGIPYGESREGGVSNAEIGYLLETGSPAMNLPARPHLVPGVEAAQDEVSIRLTKAVDAALDGNKQRMLMYLNAAGMKATMSVKRYITTGEFASLAPLTIKARQARGKKSEKPLIDTGQMRNAHTYIVMHKGKEVGSA